MSKGKYNEALICKIVTSLHVKSFEEYETIVAAGKCFDDVYFVEDC